ncbi:MAG: hypothetical protein ACFHVJ_11950 [Aestuariibacter sp.]
MAVKKTFDDALSKNEVILDLEGGKTTSRFLGLAALCSILGALTTIILIFLHSKATADFDSEMRLHENLPYILKSWTLFFHSQLNFIAFLGISCLFVRKYPFHICIAGIFFFIWTYTEMSQQAFLIDALNQFWRPAYMSALDSNSKSTFYTLIEGAKGISDSYYFIVIYSFGMGALVSGMALYKERGLAKAIGAASIFIGCLSLSVFLGHYLSLNQLSIVVSWGYEYIYPILQPATRIAIAWYLYQSAIRIESETAE